MNLNLERPLIVFDLETTGLAEPIRVVQIAAIKYSPGGAVEEKQVLFNPERPIEPEASQLHGITDAMVASEKPFASYAKSIAQFFLGCDLCGFNLWKYDWPILKAEFERVRVSLDLNGVRFIDVMQLYHHFFPRDLSAAYREYCGAELEGAHGALADARAAAEVLFRQIERHGLPNDPAGLDAFLKKVRPARTGGGGGNGGGRGGRLRVENGQTLLNFGKHRGKSLQWLAQNQRDYLEWIVGSDFDESIKNEVRKYL